MILDELVLHNVGTFAGQHTFTLTPTSPTKPIILIGGLNGTGKTTILESIHLALYGALAPQRRRAESYDNYLRNLIHRAAPPTEGAAIELTFHAHRDGNEHRFLVRRSWRSTGASIREILTIHVDGQYDHTLTSTWNEYVETFVPRGIAGLFFFDGEQIEALADLEQSQEVLDSALAALLGLDLVDRLSTDLAVLRRRHRAEHLPDSLREAVEQRKQAAGAVRQDEQKVFGEIGAARVELERGEKRLFELTEQFRSAGGDLLEKRDAAETRVAFLRKNQAVLEDELREELAGAAPLLQVAGLLDVMNSQADAEVRAEREQVIAGAIADRDKTVLDWLLHANVPGKVLADIEQFFDADHAERRAAAATAIILGLRDPGLLKSLSRAALPDIRGRLEALLDRRRALNSELDQAERLLVAIPDPESLAPVRAELDAANVEVLRITAKLSHLEERLTALRQQRARAEATYEAALDRAAQANLAADDDRRLVEHLDRVRTTLQQLRSAATQRHTTRISGLVLEALQQLLRKNELVTDVHIDPESRAVELTGPDGHPVPTYRLSAGERQLLAVSLLWGLARAAGQPLPVVIDTPLGRLDHTHRTHLLDRYFPHASHQVILLSTDTEIDVNAYPRLRQHIARAYRLEFAPSAQGTRVLDGYFWE